MALQTGNSIATGIRTPGSRLDAMQAHVAGSSGIWKGFQPLAHLAGMYDIQGSVGGRWVAADWIITALGGAGTTLTPQDSQPSTATFVTRATADGDGYSIQWSMDGGTTAQEIFKPTANLNIYFHSRFKLDNAANDAQTKGRVVAGLVTKEVDDDYYNATRHSGSAAGIALFKDSGDANVDYALWDGGAATTDADSGADLANDTYTICAFRVNGVSSVDFLVDSTKVNQATVTNIPTEELALTFQGETSEAAAITFTLQSLIGAQEAL